MSRIPQINPESATGRAKELLDAVKGKLGLVPNMTRAMANSPAVLDGYLSLSGSLSKGNLSAKQREQMLLGPSTEQGLLHALGFGALNLGVAQ